MTNSNQLDFHEPTLQQVADLCSQFGFTCAGEADLACLRAVLREGFLRWGNHSADASKMVGHQPAPPAEGEMGKLVKRLRDWHTIPTLEERDRAADLLEQRHPEPVPVSERLPEPSTKVLAHYFNALGNGRTICAIWVPAKSRSDEGDLDRDDFLEYDEEGDKYYWPEGWYEAIENWEELGWVKVYEGEVVYWQPLPKWPALPLSAEEYNQGENNV